MRTAVVIAGWQGHDRAPLEALLSTFERYPAGLEHDLVLCVNGAGFDLPPSLRDRFASVFVRENTGYNLGAWDHAWRRLPEHERFLFVQDECTALRRNWLAAFATRFDRTPGCGLVGEHLNRPWDRRWTELCASEGTGGARARTYLATLERWGAPAGDRATHLTTVVQYTSRAVLEAVGGYRIGASYDEAIAAEIGFSRAVADRGLALVQLGTRRHCRIAHPQWPSDGVAGRLSRSLKKRLLER